MLDYGIEIEFMAPVDQTQATISAAILAAGVPCYAAGYSHTFERTQWKLVTDGSLSGGNGMELVSPPLTEAGFEQIEKACAVLRDLGCTVNRTCGLHVHVGARNHSVAALRKLAALYIEHEPVIDQLLPTSRRGSNNNYCQSLVNRANLGRLASATNVNAIAEAVHPGTRYVKLNFQAFWRHGTVEFRQHSGTIEAAKIIKWVVLCSKMVEAAVRDAYQPIVAPVQVQTPTPRWRGPRGRRGRQLTILAEMVARTGGVTNEELRVALGIQSRPGIRRQLERVGVPVHVVGRRGGYEVFRLYPVSASVALVSTTPVTLEGLYNKLGLSDEDKQFWAARAATLAGRPLEHNP